MTDYRDFIRSRGITPPARTIRTEKRRGDLVLDGLTRPVRRVEHDERGAAA